MSNASAAAAAASELTNDNDTATSSTSPPRSSNQQPSSTTPRRRRRLQQATTGLVRPAKLSGRQSRRQKGAEAEGNCRGADALLGEAEVDAPAEDESRCVGILFLAHDGVTNPSLWEKWRDSDPVSRVRGEGEVGVVCVCVFRMLSLPHFALISRVPLLFSFPSGFGLPHPLLRLPERSHQPHQHLCH